MISNCEQCGTGYTKVRHDQRFCSKRCRGRHTAANNPRTCEQPGCDNPHRAKGYCHNHYRLKRGRASERAVYPCAVCGTQVERHNSGPARRADRLPTCSNRCRNIVGRGWRTDLPADHPARWCGQSMGVAYTHCKFCSNLFAHDARWPRTYCSSHGPDSKPRFVSGQCVECGEWFIGDRLQFFGGYGKQHCSTECQARRARRNTKENRRARKRDAYVADVVRRKVYQSDDWRCHICGKKVKRRAKVPDPMAPTIDHVIPLADGGTHEPANCRTAHFICNSLKGARGGGEQMLLLAV